jgi:hypothetical protein
LVERVPDLPPPPPVPTPPRLPPPSAVVWDSRPDRGDPAVVAGLSAPERPDRHSPDDCDVPDGEAWPAKDCGAPERLTAP